MTNEELTNAINSTYNLMTAAYANNKSAALPYEAYSALSTHFDCLLNEQYVRAQKPIAWEVEVPAGVETLR